MRRQFLFNTVPLCVAICLGASWLVSGGVLDPPPGPVTATGRFGPRVDVLSLSNGGIPGVAHSIDSPGSYYLSGNVTAVTGSGIRIAASDVTLDLNGFSVIGGPGTETGITSSPVGSVLVKNGIIEGWGGHGLAIGGGHSMRIEDVLSYNNGGWGIVTSSTFNNVVSGCIAGNNGSLQSNTGGIFSSGGSMVIDCVSHENTGAGIALGDNTSVITRCVSRQNTVTDYQGESILVRGCVGLTATLTGPTLADNHGF